MNTPLRLRIAKRIHEIMQQKGLKQRDMPDITGLSKHQVSRLLKGSFTIDTIELLEKKLKYPIVKVENAIHDFVRSSLRKRINNK